MTGGANSTDPLARAVHGTNPQNLIEKILRSRIYESIYWKEHCFGLTSETLVDKAMSLQAVGGTYGGNQKPTPFMCLILKMLQIQPEKEIIVEFIKNEEFKYVRVLGAFYLRLVGRPLDIYQYLEPLYNDFRKVRKRAVIGWEMTHIDEIIDTLLRDEYFADVALPRLPKRAQLEEANMLVGMRQSALEADLDEDDDEAEDDGDGKEKEANHRNEEKRNGNREEREYDRDRRRGDQDRRDRSRSPRNRKDRSRSPPRRRDSRRDHYRRDRSWSPRDRDRRRDDRGRDRRGSRSPARRRRRSLSRDRRGRRDRGRRSHSRDRRSYSRSSSSGSSRSSSSRSRSGSYSSNSSRSSSGSRSPSPKKRAPSPKKDKEKSKPKKTKTKGIKGLKPKKGDAKGKDGKVGDEGDVEFWNAERAKLGLKPLK